jgi:hypothetical protein
LNASPDKLFYPANVEPFESQSRLFLRADFLYWTTLLSGLELGFGTSSFIMNNPSSIRETFEVDLDPRFEWKSGYRFAYGIPIGCSHWELDAFWTQFRNKGRRTSHGSNKILNTGSCKVSFDQVDVVAAYQYAWYSLLFKPFLGFRAAKIDQNIKAKVSGEILILPDTLAIQSKFFDDQQYFKGAGPTLGCEASWEIAYGFEIYGTAGFGLLYGNYNVKFDDKEVASEPFSTETISHNRRHLHRLNYNIDLALGLLWHTCLFQKCELYLKISFEHHEYFNQSYLGANPGDLSFNGGVASLEIAF